MLLFTLELPVILVKETSYTAQRTTDVTLHCDISKFTNLKVEWGKTSGDSFSLIKIENDTKYSGGTIHCPSLTIKDIKTSDEGSYLCLAINDFGSIQSSAISLHGE